MRIAVLVDSCLSARLPESVANWHASRRAVERLDAQLTVHLGQLSLDAGHADGQDFVARMVRRWPTELRAVPPQAPPNGSGQAAPQGAWAAWSVPALAAGQGLVAWRQCAEDWLLVGVGRFGLGAGADELTQTGRASGLARLADRLVHLASQPWAPPHLALFCHRPLHETLAGAAGADQPVWPRLLADRLMRAGLVSRLRLVVAGHSHLALDTVVDGVRHLWLPPHGTVLADAARVRPRGGAVGLGLLELDDAGSAFELWCPDGLRRQAVPGPLSSLVGLAQPGLAAGLPLRR